MQTTSNTTQKLPFLPGCTFTDPTVSDYKKGQTFNYKNGTRNCDSSLPRGTASTKLASTSADLYAKPAAGEQYIPSWVVFDKQVLRFNANFKEVVHDSPSEPFRVRLVNILFYLEDDSVSVMEDRTQNSGLPQGTLVRRHRIPGENGQVLTVKDFNVGMDVTFYGRTYHITDCDQFTKDFFAKLNITVGEPEEPPEDPHTETRKKQLPISQRATANDQTVQGTLPGLSTTVKRDPLLQFLQNDRRVLRFYCIWKDRASASDARQFTLHYFLADDTIEVLERIPPNSGRDPFPTFMKRQALPKGFGGLLALKIGSSINIYNRDFLIYDVDSFTQQFYKENYNITDFTPIEVEEKSTPLPKRAVPEHTGFGTEEDSLGCVAYLEPKPPKRDLAKQRENEGKVLRFQAKFADKSLDQTRTFVIGYFLNDDSMNVLELPQRNLAGGKFFERARIKNPEKQVVKSATVEEQRKAQEETYYHPADFYLGAKVTINSHTFVLTDASEYSFRFMEAHPREWPTSDISAVLDTISSVVQSTGLDLNKVLAAADTKNTGTLDNATFEKVLTSNGIVLQQQQQTTLERALDVNNDKLVHYTFLVKFLSTAGQVDETSK